MNQQSNHKPILCLDFDGVIHSYKTGWHGAENIPDPPVPGVFQWIDKALQHFDIYVYSSRSIEDNGRLAMMEYISKHGSPDLVELLRFTAEKPRAFMTIDDRGILFNGDWSDPQYDPATLRMFKPWYQFQK